MDEPMLVKARGFRIMGNHFVMKTALLIDDDRASRLILARWLAADGWQVLEAEDGEVGLQLTREKQPDVVLCDLLMPRCNGFQFCRTLREEQPPLSETKVVIATSSSYNTDRHNALECGADAFLIKPLHREEILPLMNRLRDPSLAGESKPEPAAPAPTPAMKPEEHHCPAPEGPTPTLVRFWGVRGSIPTPGPQTAYYGGNTSCVEVRADGQLIVLDAGSGIRPLGLHLLGEYKSDPIALTLLMTHTHWDHIQGFPFFVPAYNSKNRLRILGYEGAKTGLSKTLSSQMESPYFPISMQEMPGYIVLEELKDMAFKIGPVQVRASFVNHPGICVGYRLFTSAGSVVYIPDNESFQRQKASAIKDDNEASARILEYAQQQDQKLIDFIRDADVLIIDSQYDAQEYPTKVGWGHTCVDDSVAIALKANVRKLFLFHHDPGHDDEHISRMESHARELVRQRGATMEVEAAREGTQHILSPASQPQAATASREA